MTMPIRAAALLTGVALLAAACAGGGHTGAPRSPAPGAAVGARRAPDAPAGPRARAEHHVWALAAGAPTVAPTPARAAPFASPVEPHNQPTPLAGDVNGQMPQGDLVAVGPGCQAARAAAPSLGLLLATARDEGVALGTVQCYRPLSDQVAVGRSWTAAGNSACAAPVVTTTAGRPKDTSMHGWGKAADFSYRGSSLGFGSPGYDWLTGSAGRFGWNHPAWARPGGSACPEAWHWEWVGDGGLSHASPIRADVAGILPSADGGGYAVFTALGAVVHRGDAAGADAAPIRPLGALVVAAAPSEDGRGYWLAGSDGGVFSFGDAPFLGSAAGRLAPGSVVGIAPSAGGKGYWLATTSGQVYPFGVAADFGSPASASARLTRPLVAIAASPDGAGYWLVGSDGGVFSYGDAVFHGSAAGRPLPAPVVAMAASPDGGGYWLAGADGSVYPFGDAGSFGDAGHQSLSEPVVGIAATPSGRGYWLVAADGGVFSFGDAAFRGAG